MSGRGRPDSAADLVIGGQPRVNLLPPEVRARRQGRTVRRGLVVAMVLVALLVGGGSAGAAYWAGMQQKQLLAAQERTSELLAEQATFAEVGRVKEEVAATIAARQLGASAEVDWKAYLVKVRAALPANVSIETIVVDSTGPLVPYAQSAVPLQPTRVATLTLSLTSPTLPTVPKWLRDLRSLPGYVDGTPNSITKSEAGNYLVSLTVHMNDEAFTGRFADPEVAE